LNPLAPWSDRPVHAVRLAALLALLAMFGPFTIDAFFPAFNAVAAELRATPWLMQQTISIYLLSYALMSLFHGPLSDAYGRRRVVLWGVVLYTAASVGCALVTTIEQLLFFRALQGVATGAGLIVGRAIVRDLYDGPQAQRVMSLITLFFGVAPAIAPVIGAVVYKLANWEAVFWFLALYGAGLWWLCLRSLPETHPLERRTRFAPRPLFDVYRVIALDGRFVLLVLATGFNFGVSFLYIASAPAFIESILGMDALGYPWFFVPMIAGMMGGAALSNRLAGSMLPRRQVALGYLIMAIATAWSLAYNLWVARPTVPWAVLPVFMNAIAISMIFPVLSIKMLDRYPRHRGSASSMQAFIWGLCTSAIAAVLSPALSHGHRSLAAGAAVLGCFGWLCWRWYAALTPPADAERDPHRVVEEPVETS
jgi:DHA1 family bicyclomycin/chloramphenicol resistance-like MFS transporter